MEIPKDDERPPEEIWKDAEAITAWFQDVKDRRENEYESTKNKTTEVPLDQNEATRGLKERLSGR